MGESKHISLERKKADLFTGNWEFHQRNNNSMALLPDRETYPELKTSPVQETLSIKRRLVKRLSFNFVGFCANFEKFVQVVSCCQVIYIKS